MRVVRVLFSIAAICALAAAPVMAQTQAPAPPPAKPAPAPAEKAPVEKAKEVEGTVKKVDPAKKSVQVSSGLLGLFGATVEVTDATRINVEGKEGSLADIREGSKVKAAYESRDGKNVATSIDVMPAEEKAPARTGGTSGSTAPAPSTSSGSSMPPSTSPSTGQPKTP